MMQRFFVIAILFGLWLSVGGAAETPKKKGKDLEDPKKNPRYKEAVKVEPIRFYSTVDEAAQAFQSVMKGIMVRRYESETTLAFPLLSFALHEKMLILKYDERGRPVEKAFSFDKIRLTGNILSPNANDPYWDLWLVNDATSTGVPEIVPLGSLERNAIEVVFHAIHSWMAAAQNPHILSRNIPPTLSFAFRGERGGAPVLMRPIKWGFAVVPDESGEGLKVTRVDPGSPSERAGLQPEDRILEINAVKVSKVEEVRTLLRPSENTLNIRRGEEEKIIKLFAEAEF